MNNDLYSRLSTVRDDFRLALPITLEMIEDESLTPTTISTLAAHTVRAEV